MSHIKELERFQEPIDPLVIVLNRHQYWYNNGLCCRFNLKIDKNLFNESEVMNDNPHIYNTYKKLTCKIKYTKIELR